MAAPSAPVRARFAAGYDALIIAMRASRLLLSACVGLLVVLGVFAAYGRSVHVDDWLRRVEPARAAAFSELRLVDPFASDRPADVERLDRKFGDHPRLTLLHTVPGGLFLAFALLQFSSRVRERWIIFHRWSGRVLIAAAVLTTVPTYYFGVMRPYGGPAEAVAIVVFAFVFIGSLSVAYVAIRRGNVARHREWMIRAFAVALGISTVRVVGLVFDLALTPAGLRPAVIFVLSVWTGWLITVSAAELWLWRTRLSARAAAVRLGAIN
jgi:uncharacterized membrane protein